MALYYVALGIMWCTLWCVTALLLADLPKDLKEYYSGRWHRWSVAGIVVRVTAFRPWLLALVMLAFGAIYVLGYAPLEKARRTAALPVPAAMMDLYVPVQWLIDQSLLREPLLQWADLWGMRVSFELASSWRKGWWGTTPPWIYAMGWVVAGIVCSAGPAFIVRWGLLRLVRTSIPVAARSRT